MRLTWQEIDKGSLKGGCLEIYIDQCGLPDILRGRIGDVVWVEEFPQFHLSEVSAFNHEAELWTPADTPIAVYPPADGEGKVWTTDPLKNPSYGVYQFYALPYMRFFLYPHGLALPHRPIGLEKVPTPV